MSDTTNNLTFGVVGIGRIGSDHARTMRTVEGVGDIVLADVNPARAEEVATELGARTVTPEKILDEVEALVVTTPTSQHAEYIIAAAERGIPVFTEKPVALDAETTKKVADVVARTGTLVQVGFQRRFDGGYANAKKRFETGDIGELRRVHITMGDFPPPPASYIPGSGFLYKDCLIHDIDALRWVTGREIVEVFTVGKNRGASYFGELGDIDESVGVFTLDDDTIATFQLSRYNGAGYDIRMELFGTEETLAVGFNTFMPVTSAEPDFVFEQAGERFPNFYPRFIPAYKAEIREFISTVHAGGTSAVTVADALQALYVCDALDLSRHEHRPVRVADVRV
ncbi:myo-inositol 2-dehydrogenase / D-chiro-inositol 1-dehydrogenase [Raineyella antarctica]|uniref:Myo-inositol 2-dehydrogenase / D-chiro-inositol 1-dehydrogenase n=1 Tax=Raineyella antarctica TaxID=1577474 RepID=A0A1G6GEY1_9ACTN|nr:Gfo/Idh/MocA family oxidoreductase [Raineyella antarctica]SDB80561.1 myo-inositol 2-dehydrogenase / D-chiro-inositol 1-dehydrogenase [Raineyella antarctica]